MQDTENTFTALSPTARNHFILYFFAAIYRLVNYLRIITEKELDETFTEYPFLGSYFSEMLVHMPEGLTWRAGLDWWQQQIGTWEGAIIEQEPTKSDQGNSHQASHLPLLAFAKLDFKLRLALVLIGLVEEDSRFGTVFERLQSPLPHRRPTLEMVARMLADVDNSAQPDPWQLGHSLVRHGLATIRDKDVPRSEWLLSVPSMLWDLIRGDEIPQPASWYLYRPLSALPTLDDLILPAEVQEQFTQVPKLLKTGKAQAIVIRGTDGSEREQTIASLAQALGLNLIVVKNPESLVADMWQQLSAFCAMGRALPLLRFDLDPGETKEIPGIAEYESPLGIVLGQAGGLRGKSVQSAVTLTLPSPTVKSRRQAWQAALGDFPVDGMEAISERFQLPIGHIRRVAALAIAEAGLSQHGTIGLKDVQRACRLLNRQQLDTLANRVEADGHWEQLVVSDQVANKLRELEQRCRYREHLLDHLSPTFRGSTNRGVRALFSGGSGTGKTLAARVLAAELGMDLYQVDLAAVVNKYIGETEKNIHQVLSTAEVLDVILLLDEGDGLLGNRTEVHTANDRYANLETNYLLQRLENYQGIVLITSNASENIDSAFQRRLDVVVNFVAPQASARWMIWQLHLPPDHRVDPVALERISTRCEMTGGQIRNASLQATLIALGEGRSIETHHLEEAIRSEYRKAGSQCPLLNGYHQKSPRANGIESFLNSLT